MTHDFMTIAKLAHEANREYCKLLGDDTQPDWLSAPEWQKNSAIQGVRFIIEHPEATPFEQHEQWMQLKLQEGWKYGPVKDIEKKEHPCMMPYMELPESQRFKDILFRCIVKAAIARSVGL